MLQRITIALPEGATDQLGELARREMRDPKAQAAVLILEGLRRAGLPVDLASPQPETLPDTEQAAAR